MTIRESSDHHLCSNDTEASQHPETKTPSPTKPTHLSQSFRDKLVLLRVGKAFNGRTGVRCNEMVHERWLAALETAKSNTNFQSVLSADATKCSLTLTRACGRGCIVSRLAHPLYHSTSCSALS